jgi:hypothetical protein
MMIFRGRAVVPRVWGEPKAGAFAKAVDAAYCESLPAGTERLARKIPNAETLKIVRVIVIVYFF